MILVNASPAPTHFVDVTGHDRARRRVARTPPRVPRARRPGRARDGDVDGARRGGADRRALRHHVRGAGPLSGVDVRLVTVRGPAGARLGHAAARGRADGAGVHGRRRRLARRRGRLVGGRASPSSGRRGTTWTTSTNSSRGPTGWTRCRRCGTRPRCCAGTRTRRTSSTCGSGARPVVPTVVLLGGSAASLDGICDAQGWNAVVVKPAVASGAKGARRADVGDAGAQAHLDDLLARGDVLVQQFVPAIEHEGEWSVVLVDGRVGHALRKRPAAGDYRVQEEWGGTRGARRAEREPRRARDAGVRDPARARVVRARSTSCRSAGSGTSWRSR